jgi:Cu+-exporting ATPase
MKGENMLEEMKDPVCGMKVTPETAQARSQYQGETHYFCSLDCKATFDRNPEKYVRQEQEQRR